MGQACCCCPGLLVNKSRRRHTGHKRFDFAPKKSWKYKDATLLNEFHEMEMSHGLDSHSDRDQLIDANGAAATPTDSIIVNSNQHYQQENDISSDEEEINTGNYRPSGRLVFSEGDSDDEEEIMTASSSKIGYSQLQPEEENRDRSQSNGSEQIGRFQVWDVVDNGEESSPPNSPRGQQLSVNNRPAGGDPSTTPTHAQEETTQLMADPQT